MNKTDSADLIMKLYDLRREDKMRAAREWFISYFPESADEIIETMIDRETSAKYRMVTSYWEMAASFVNHGAIDEQMFTESNGEHIVVFSKIAPFIEELREKFQSPQMMANLEKLIMKMPDAKEMLSKRREMMKNWIEMSAQKAQAAK